MAEAKDFHWFVSKAQAAQRAVDALGAGRPDQVPSAADRRDLVLCTVDRRELAHAMMLFEQAARQRDTGCTDAPEFEAQARAILGRMLGLQPEQTINGGVVWR